LLSKDLETFLFFTSHDESDDLPVLQILKAILGMLYYAGAN